MFTQREELVPASRYTKKRIGSFGEVLEPVQDVYQRYISPDNRVAKMPTEERDFGHSAQVNGKLRQGGMPVGLRVRVKPRYKTLPAHNVGVESIEDMMPRVDISDRRFYAPEVFTEEDVLRPFQISRGMQIPELENNGDDVSEERS